MSKILLVEDDQNLREIFEMRLQAEGYQTLTAGDGEEALVVAMKEKPDLIIADVMMPKLSGFEMLETLRAAPEMATVKVVMMTALGQAEDRARGEKLGVVKYLVKSQVTLEDFVRVVREVLQPNQAAAATPAAPATDLANTNSLVNNKQESEKAMQEDTTPTNAPSGGSMPGSDPIGTPPAGGAMGGNGSDPMSTDEEKQGVQEKVDESMGPSAVPGQAPTGDSPGSDVGGGMSMPPTSPPMPEPTEEPDKDAAAGGMPPANP